MAFDLTNQRFGRLLVIKQAPNKGKDRAWECLCDCGKSHVTITASLRHGVTKSCGCFQQEVRSKGINVRHGHFRNGVKSSESGSWNSMNARCNDTKFAGWSDYGGRGIKVCERWRKGSQNGFINFISDMGLKPGKEYSLDRIDNNGDYSPDNCRWTTPRAQAANRRIKRIENFTDSAIEQEFWRRKDLSFMASYVSGLPVA